MIPTQDMMEKLLSSTEEKEQMDERPEEKEGSAEEQEERSEEVKGEISEEIKGDISEEVEDISEEVKEDISEEVEDRSKEEGCEEEDDKSSEDEDQANDDSDKAERVEEVEETAQDTDKPEKVPLPAQAKGKKEADVLNLNNEVVKMRKEVKRVRVLIIRKLTRQIGALKKKKGKEAEIEKNQRRAARLLEEVHAMKILTPDVVTKTALQKTLNFEEVCKNTKSSISDRAVARIATHPQFNKKIESIKAAVKAFKEERMKAGKQGGKEKAQNKSGKVNSQSPDKRGEKLDEQKVEDVTVPLKEISENKEVDVILEDSNEEAKPEIDTVIGAEPVDTDVLPKQIPESKSVEPASTKSSNAKDTVKNKPQRKDAGKKQNVAVYKNRKEEEESEVESSDAEEKEYFDDSTEERFLKQSSQSEESEDDFFVGKVSKFKKKKKKQNVGEEERKGEEGQEVKGESTDKVKTSDKVQRELDELESRLKSKATSLQSVFCSTLSGSKQAAGRGRGDSKFRGQRQPHGGSGFNRDFSKQFKFQKQVSGEEGNSGSKYSKPCPEGRWQETEEKSFTPAGRGRGGRGRGEVRRQNMPMGRGAFSHQPPQQALHPSWEASKKRKEQQGQILAFQGKKIKFDDDD